MACSETDNGQFQDKWTEQYFCVLYDERAMCLVCAQNICSLNENDIKEHYILKHLAYESMTGQARKNKLLNLQEVHELKVATFEKELEDSRKCVKASYLISNFIARELHPPSDGMFIQSCLRGIFAAIYPEKKELVGNIELSSLTIIHQIHRLAKNIQHLLTKRASTFSAYSLALDKSTDITSTTKFAVFIRGVDTNFNITEEMASLNCIEGTVTGQGILEELEKVLSQFGLSYKDLVSIATDGTPAMAGMKDGLVGLIKDRMESQNIHSSSLIVCHSIIHKDTLFIQALNFQHVTSALIKAINFIQSSGLEHRQFQELLEDIEEDYGNAIFMCEDQWLSKVGRLERVYNLLEEITAFLDEKNNSIPELTDAEWRCDLAFLMDIAQHLNTLNTKLQGKHNLISDLFSLIEGFCRNIRLWESHLKRHNTVHFPTLSKQGAKEWQFSKYADKLIALHEEFLHRFEGMKHHAMAVQLFVEPFTIDVKTIPKAYEMEIIDLQHSTGLKTKYSQSNSLLEFYKNHLPRAEYPQLFAHAQKMLSVFGGTYSCEKLISKVDILARRELRPPTKDSHLLDTLYVAMSSIEPNIDHLAQ